ncbi:MAG: RipA family octameric membrane protein [Candidatus Nitrosocosmicus sp.]
MDKDLLDLYKMAIDEYRFEVNLSWDSVRFFTTLHTGILAFGSSLLGLHQSSFKWALILVFVVGIILAYVAYTTRSKYREYYLRALYTKTLIEDQLKLREPLKDYQYPNHFLAVSPTEKIDNPKESLKNPEEWIKKNMKKSKTVTAYQQFVFILFGFIYGVLIAISLLT